MPTKGDNKGYLETTKEYLIYTEEYSREMVQTLHVHSDQRLAIVKLRYY